MNKLNFEGEKLLVVGAGPSQAAGIKKAKDLGCHVIAIDGNSSACGFKYAQESEVIDFSNVEKAVSFAKGRDIDAVVTFACEAALPAVSTIGKVFDLPALTPDQVQLVSNKYNLRRHCVTEGIAVPFFAPAYNLDECYRACRQMGFPCVIKPMDSSGSRGVALVFSEKDVKAVFFRAFEHTSTGVLVEEFMDGLESSVEGFVLSDGIHILTLSDKQHTPPPYFVDTDAIFPTKYTGEQLEAIEKMAIRIMESLQVSPTPFHMEVLMTRDGPRLVEIGLRGPGFKIFSDIIPHVTGVDVLFVTIALAFGYNVSFEPKRKSGGVIKFIGGKHGMVRTVSGIDKARNIKGVYDVELYIKPGDITHCLKSGSDRIGQIIAFADTRNKAICVANQAKENIQINYY